MFDVLALSAHCTAGVMIGDRRRSIVAPGLEFVERCR
jgi:hypothetical protein